jgi:ferredoxin
MAAIGAEACTGCNLCVLPCPVFRREHDVMLTMHGRMRAIQGGASAADLAGSWDQCLLCGACQAVCPEEINLLPIAVSMRQANIEAGLSKLPQADVDKADLRGGIKILRNPRVRAALGPDDFLVIDSRPYHDNFKESRLFYDQLKKETGCQLSLDLQRAAIATGSTSVQARAGFKGLELNKQADWLMLGRRAKRVIVENPLDKYIVQQASPVAVIELWELAQ